MIMHSKLSKFITLFIALLLTTFTSFAQDKPLWLRFSAISPDGSKICFAYKGDLWIVDSNGGEARPLTTHIAADRHPVWSPDGKTIAFASDRHGNFDVFTIPADGGEAKRITAHSTGEIPTAFSPDGQRIYFYALRMDDARNAQFPSGALPETYSINTTGGIPKIEIHTGSQFARPDMKGERLIYQDRKGYEDEHRKHHVSSVTRDIWMYDVKLKKHSKLTSFDGEDRDAWWSADGKGFYWLSEKSGSFNLWYQDIQSKAEQQLTRFDKHPVRHLSIDQNGNACFSYHGEIYLLKKGAAQPSKVNISIRTDAKQNEKRYKTFSSEATEMAISPNGKEIAFVIRGEIFVTSIDYDITKRITNTAEQERSVSFSPDGRSILYAAERTRNDGTTNWDIWKTSIVREEEPYFFKSTLLKEEMVLGTIAEEFQPLYSPDGKEVAYLEERTKLKVLNLESGKTRLVLDSIYNYSYSDGDQHYDWSPDGKYFLVKFIEKERWVGEVGLVPADGSKPPVNLTNSGYNDTKPMWMQGGKSAIWFADRFGMRSHGSWGSQNDVFAMFFTRDAWDEFCMSKDEYDLMKEMEKARKKVEEKDKKNDDGKGKKTEKKDEDKDEPIMPGRVKPKKITPLELQLDGIEFRTARITVNSSALADAVLTPDGSKLYYLSAFEKGFDLWVHKLRENETKLVAKLGERSGSLSLGEDGKIYVLGGGKIMQVDTAKGAVKNIPFKAEMEIKSTDERAYMFDHAWRQTLKKFYLADMHGVDWDFYKREYAVFLPHLNNGYDFADVLGEMLGELNVSHTGGRYNPDYDESIADQTASLGVFIDNEFKGPGIKVTEVLKRGPFDYAKSLVTAGAVIEKIDGILIDGTFDWALLLNRKVNKTTLIEGKTADGKAFAESIKPISLGEENELRYQRWVLQRRTLTDQLSNGRIGYVHVRGMNDGSFREVYSEALGRMNDKEGIIIDTRFNGGGWLHDDLATLFSGNQYVQFVPRGQIIGSEPQGKWQRKSAMLMSESNYSDAHFSPYVYKELGIGKLIGMPVPGTATAVWWERMIDGTIFGIPQVGVMGRDGKYLENQQLNPDILVNNEYEALSEGRDQQIEKAVEFLLGK
jgi:Tol biopolymer transport system component/C-terminal processing protease CtpA/Prc